MSFNKIVLVGNIGRNPEVRFTPQGQQVCEFSLATNEKRIINGETKDETTWFQVSIWGRLAETISEYLSKGRLVYVEGRLRVREWTDKEGRQRFSLEVIGTELKFLGNRAETNNDHEQQPAQNNATTVLGVDPQVVEAPSPVAPASAPTPVVREEPLPKANKSRNYKANGKVTVSDPFI
jgi:single-strand DNA-binding protein